MVFRIMNNKPPFHRPFHRETTTLIPQNTNTAVCTIKDDSLGLSRVSPLLSLLAEAPRLRVEGYSGMVWPWYVCGCSCVILAEPCVCVSSG